MRKWLLVSLALTGTLQSIWATNGTWSFDGVDGLWSGSTNWVANTIADGTSSTANFNTLNITAARTVVVDGARTVGVFLVGDITGNQKYTFTATTGGTLTFNNGGSGAQLNTFGTGPVQFDVPLVLADHLTVTKAAGGAIIFGGPVTGTGNFTVANDATNSITFNGSSSLNFSGSLIMNGTGAGAYTLGGDLGANVQSVVMNSANSVGATLSGSNTAFTGEVSVTAGSLNVTSISSLSSANVVAVGSSGTFSNNTTNPLIVAGFNGSGVVMNSSSAARNITVGGTGAYSFAGSIKDGVAVGATYSFIKAGSGTQTLSGVSTYTGSTSINAGTLIIGTTGVLSGSTAVSVAGGAKLLYSNTTTALAAPVTLNGSGTTSRAILGGDGTIGTAVTLDNLGDTLSPGNSPGVLSFNTSQVWASNSYDWEVNNFTGITGGTDFDAIAITGSLDLSGGSNSYQLNVISLTAGNLPGNVPNFSDTTTSWTILTATAGITGFAAADWIVNTGGFTSSPTATGIWSISLNDTVGTDSLVLTYTVPEPSTWLLFAFTGLVFFLGKRSFGQVRSS